MATQKANSATKKASKTTTKPKAGNAVSVKPKTTKIAAPVKSAAKPAAKNTATAVKKSPVKKTMSALVKFTGNKKAMAKPTPEERYRMVELAAYFIAEQHGFQGRSDEHWAAAERAIAAKLGS